MLNVHKTFRRRPGRLLNVLCTFNLRPVSTGFAFPQFFSDEGKVVLAKVFLVMIIIFEFVCVLPLIKDC